MLGEGWQLTQPDPPPDPDQVQDDLLALRLELVLTALDSLAESLRDLPQPQVFIDAPDLSAIVQAVNGLKPGADPEEIAQAVVKQIAPTAQKPEPDAVQGELVKALEKLDFRLQGIGNSSAGTVLDLKDNAARQLGVVSIAGGGGGGTVDTSLLAKDATLTNGTQHTLVDNFPATQAVSATALPLPAGAATESTLAGVAKDATFAKDADGGIKTHVQNFPATQAVSLATNTPDVTDRVARLLGHVTVDNASIPVTGTFFQATQPVSLATNTPDVTDRAARLLGHVTVDNASLAVTGTFWQATQPVSATSLPLPSGASTETTLAALSAKLPSSAAAADALANPTVSQVGADNMLFNGSTWDRQRGLGVSTTTGDTGAKTATGNGATQTNVGNKGIQVLIVLGTVSGTTPTCVFKLQGSVDGGTTWYDIPGAATASLTASVSVGITVYPGVTAVTGATTTGTTAAASQPLPRNWRVVWTISGTLPSFTITSITYNYLVN